MENLRAWLALVRTPGLGPASIGALIRRYGSAQATLRRARSDPDLVSALKPETAAALATPDWRAVDRDLAWADKPGCRILLQDDAQFPPQLKHISGAPLLLFVRGDVTALREPQIAMVGSRNPSPGGRQAAHDLAGALVAHGFVITSGLAVGIDGACHQGALDGAGRTVAVGATGPDRVYPSRHARLAEHIVASNGALVTEFPTGVPPAREHFPRRNRIISGLALGTVVVEAALKSGSLITAHYALDQNREVFAVPGSIYNPNAAGCHALIKQGAKLAERADDIVEEFVSCVGAAGKSGRKVAPEKFKDGELRREQDRVLNAIGFEPASIDTVVERTGMATEQVTSIVMELEIEGRVTSMSSGMYVRQARSSAP